MQWPLRILIILLAGALALPMVLPVAADGDDADGDDDEGAGDGPRSGSGNDDGSTEAGGDGDEGRDKDRSDDDGGRDDKEGRGDKDGKKEEKSEGKRDEKDKDTRKEEKDRGRHGDEDRGNGKDEDRKDDHDDYDDDVQDGSDREPAGPVSGGGSPAFPLHATSDRADVRVSQDYDISPGVLTYTFRIANNGGAIARDVQLDGELPDIGGWVLTDALHCDLATDGDVDCDLGDLAGGEAIEVEARSVLVGDVPSFTNVVQVYTPLEQA